ncbi:MAG: 3'(2'),5'-bisphosphate nucleotidase CysQ [Leptospira sp.]|nr:3'(2'),5'-bisphosphate nucleotidase CysQ [Leptospira sp.]
MESVLRAGRAILSIYHTDFEVRMKEADDPVTEADMQAHKEIYLILKKYFPDDILLSEEDIPSVEKRLNNSRVWILDPLDGTRDFVAKNPEFAVCLGLSVNGIAELGFVYNPVTFEIFWGGKDIGYGFKTLSEQSVLDIISNPDKLEEFINESRLYDSTDLKNNLSDPPNHNNENESIPPEKLNILVSRNEMKNNLYKDYMENESFSSAYYISSKGSIAYKLGLLARGDADLILSLKPKNEWDICGGIAILNAMGFISFEISTGSSYRFNREDTRTYGLIAGRKDLVEEFWKENSNSLQKSLSNWDGSLI